CLIVFFFLLFFFFSSRRRHTRFDCDWSSDVCSSDLVVRGPHVQRMRAIRQLPGVEPEPPRAPVVDGYRSGARAVNPERGQPEARSEERRVGKEWRSRGSTDHARNKKGQKT